LNRVLFLFEQHVCSYLLARRLSSLILYHKSDRIICFWGSG
jgi:hypothetical protein